MILTLGTIDSLNIRIFLIQSTKTLNKQRINTDVQITYALFSMQKWNSHTSFSLYSSWFSRLVYNNPQNYFLQLKTATPAAERLYASAEQTTTHIAVLANAACCWVSLEYKQSAGGGKEREVRFEHKSGGAKTEGLFAGKPLFNTTREGECHSRSL